MTNERLEEIRQEVGCTSLGCGCIVDEFAVAFVDLQTKLRGYDTMMADRHRLLEENFKFKAQAQLMRAVLEEIASAHPNPGNFLISRCWIDGAD